MYSSLEASLHDHFWLSEHGPSELDLIEPFLKNTTGPSLEIGCGSGRLLIPLLKKGHQIEGLEMSTDMLDLLRQKAKTENLSPTFHCADASQPLPTNTQYGAYLIPAFTIQLLTKPQALTLLTHLRTRCSNNPKLYLTTFIPWPEITGELEEKTWNLDKEMSLPDHATARCETNHTIDRLNQIIHRKHRYTLTPANGQNTKTHHCSQTLRYYNLPELTDMLQQTGWKIEKTITDLDPTHLDTDAHILTIQASSH